MIECAIATGPLNIGLKEQRALAKEKVYKRGATILLREALSIMDPSSPGDLPKTYVTDPKKIIKERVGEFVFEFPAGRRLTYHTKLTSQDHFSRITTQFSQTSLATHTIKSLNPSKSSTLLTNKGSS